MILNNKYAKFIKIFESGADDADLRWCSKKGRFCHEDSYGVDCAYCR